MSFHVQKWPDISNGWSDIPSKKEANKKGREKTMGGKIGRKKKKRKKKGGEVNKGSGGWGEEDRMKNRKEKERKRVGIKYLNKRKDYFGSEPSALVYIGILASTTTGHDSSVVSALASQAKGRGSIPSCGTSFFSHKYFLSNLCQGHAHLINAPLKYGPAKVGLVGLSTPALIEEEEEEEEETEQQQSYQFTKGCNIFHRL